jgi:hypothetical protein
VEGCSERGTESAFSFKAISFCLFFQKRLPPGSQKTTSGRSVYPYSQRPSAEFHEQMKKYCGGTGSYFVTSLSFFLFSTVLKFRPTIDYRGCAKRHQNPLLVE